MVSDTDQLRAQVMQLQARLDSMQTQMSALQAAYNPSMQFNPLGAASSGQVGTGSTQAVSSQMYFGLPDGSSPSTPGTPAGYFRMFLLNRVGFPEPHWVPYFT